MNFMHASIIFFMLWHIAQAPASAPPPAVKNAQCHTFTFSDDLANQLKKTVADMLNQNGLHYYVQKSCFYHLLANRACTAQDIANALKQGDKWFEDDQQGSSAHQTFVTTIPKDMRDAQNMEQKRTLVALLLPGRPVMQALTMLAYEKSQRTAANASQPKDNT